ncbi:hypothetical protein DYU11_20165 [Fibrisoma montanum]|uniref:Uncharacterized protein n=1 Tax=Fibrisoma montanum TaxID=2305895 RepID=A0A418M3S8_9BACT|nr:hypothetical protein [Fibrisoma montanum]RIV20369.1 hypothetical protein DYU11_20165 [Fibrisoma montanum]
METIDVMIDEEAIGNLSLTAAYGLLLSLERHHEGAVQLWNMTANKQHRDEMIAYETIIGIVCNRIEQLESRYFTITPKMVEKAEQ